MASANLLRLRDDFDDPKEDLRLALNQAARAARRLLEQAVDKSPMRELVSFLWKLHVKIVETDSIVKITLDDLSDVDSESILITLDAHGVLHLKVRARSASEPEVAATEVRDVQAFERHLALPPGIDRRLATARFEDGQITVTVPKRIVEPKEGVSVKTRAA